jgi:hypothetical protein
MLDHVSENAATNILGDPDPKKELEARNAYDLERARRLQARTITVGDLWRHYTGSVHRIIATAHMAISNEPCVVSAEVNRPDEACVRLRITFLNEVAEGVPRFRRLDQSLPELLHETDLPSDAMLNMKRLT